LGGRTNAAKQFDAIVDAIYADMGGKGQLSTIELRLVESFAGACHGRSHERLPPVGWGCRSRPHVYPWENRGNSESSKNCCIFNVMERIRNAFADEAEVIEGQKVGATVSIGLALHDGSAIAFTELLWKADRALYQAKEGGRNRVEWAVPDFHSRSQDGGMPLGSGAPHSARSPRNGPAAAAAGLPASP
jgi:hypothetical protein